jgi:GNAT superfamily N-acetyltransferase
MATRLLEYAPTFRSLSSSEWETYKYLRLRSLTDSPEAFGSTVAKETDRPDDEWARRLLPNDGAAMNLPLVAEVHGEPIGLAWGRIVLASPDVASVYQMWVDPSHRGNGIGKALLVLVIDWARAERAIQVELGVTCGDSPARRLYEGAGFETAGAPEPLRRGSKLFAQPMRLSLSDR